MFPSIVNITGDNSVVLEDSLTGDLAGFSVNGSWPHKVICDINNDGILDFLIGAPGNLDTQTTGKVFVVFGSKEVSTPGTFNLDTLDGKNGFVIEGLNFFDHLGLSISCIKDINGDGVSDLIVGTPNTSNNAGQAYVIFGNKDGYCPAVLSLNSLDGTNGFIINGNSSKGGQLGISVNSGDINGDMISDVIIGAFYADVNGQKAAGETYVIYGNLGNFNAQINVADLDGNNGFTVSGIKAADYSGFAVTSVDINGDGYDDVVIGAYGASPDQTRIEAGQIYVILGGSNLGSYIDITSLNGITGFTINGINSFDRAGMSISNGGDINKDGINDLLIGVPGAHNNTGQVFVFYGKKHGFVPIFELSGINGNNGYRIDGINEGDRVGYSVSGVGDINGDGFDDFIIGAPGVDSRAGNGYVIYGRDKSDTPVLFSLKNLNNNGFTIQGAKPDVHLGFSVSGAGDINKDGLYDILISAPGSGNELGKTYLLLNEYISTPTASPTPSLSPASEPENLGDKVRDVFEIIGEIISGIVATIGFVLAIRNLCREYHIVRHHLSLVCRAVGINRNVGEEGIALAEQRGRAGYKAAAV